MASFDYSVMLYEDAPRLHGNPHVATSKQLVHALRYTMGRKTFVQGTRSAQPFDLQYGQVANNGLHVYWATRTDQQALKTPRHGRVIGSLTAFAVPEDYFAKYAKDVEELAKNKKIAPHARYLTESEVTFYGLIPRQHVDKIYIIREVNVDEDSVARVLACGTSGAEWQWYRILSLVDYEKAELAEANLNMLRLAVADLVGTRHGEKEPEVVAKASNALRDVLIKLVSAHIRRDMQVKHGKSIQGA